MINERKLNVLPALKKDELESVLNDLKKKLKEEKFEDLALNLSISETAIKGGDLGWINENLIADNFRIKIMNTQIGEIVSCKQIFK